MKTLLHSLCGLSAMMLLSGCPGDNCMFPYNCDNHFISEFSTPNILVSVRAIDRNSNKRYDEGDEIWLRLGAEERPGVGTYSTGHPTFETLVEQLGDTSYGEIVGGPISVFLDTILRIDVTCSSAYDAQHAAGDTLNDLFLVTYEHAKLFIDNNYSEDFEGFDLPEGIEHVTHDLFQEPLDNFNSHGENNFPVGERLRLYPQSPPAQAGEYTFTIKVTTNRSTYLDSTSFEWQGPIPP